MYIVMYIIGINEGNLTNKRAAIMSQERKAMECTYYI